MTSIFSNAKIIGHGIDPATYMRFAPDTFRGHPDFVMSRSELCECLKNPNRWKSNVKNSDKETSSTDWGSLVDVLLLQPEKFDDQFAICPETYPDEKGNQKKWIWSAGYCKKWREDQGSKECIKKEDYESAKAAVDVLLKNQFIRELVNSSEKQVFIMAEYRVNVETASGIKEIIVPLKALLDLVPKNSVRNGNKLFDFKTSKSANPATWARSMFDFDYHVQAAFFLDMYNAATGENREYFGHLVQENFPPFALADDEAPLFILTEEFLEAGRNKYRAALDRYACCLATGYWPGYQTVEASECYQTIKPEIWML